MNYKQASRVFMAVILGLLVFAILFTVTGCKSEPPASIFDELMIIKAQQERKAKLLASKNVEVMCPLKTKRGGEWIFYPGGTTFSKHMKACNIRFGRKR